jgi:branched-chain amino acid transport system permease protein
MVPLLHRSRTAVLAGALLALAAGWVLTEGLGDPGQLFSVTLNGLTLAALYFVVASGFTLIFGLMRVVNFAHGSLFLLAGYLAFQAQGDWFGVSSDLLGGSGTVSVAAWILPLVFATLVVGVGGVAMQQVFLRWNQGQQLRQALITIALSVILADQMSAHYGGISQSIQAPSAWPGSVSLLGIHYGWFRLLIVVGAAIAVGLLLLLTIKGTRFGMVIRAGVDDREMVSALGIDVQRVLAGAFFVGSMLAGLGGVLGGTMLSVQPGNDTQFLLSSLIVVIVGGMGSLGGAAIGALALGLVGSYADVYLRIGSTDLTNYSILLTFALLVAVLAVRPYGLFGRPT